MVEKTIDQESFEDKLERFKYERKIENIEIGLLNRNPDFVDQIYFYSQEYRSKLQQAKQGYDNKDDWSPNWIK